MGWLKNAEARERKVSRGFRAGEETKGERRGRRTQGRGGRLNEEEEDCERESCVHEKEREE